MKKTEENSVVASMGRRPGLSINDRNIAFGLLEADTLVADVARPFRYIERTIYRLQARFHLAGSEMDSPRSGITTSREEMFIVTSSRRYSFMAVSNLLNASDMQQGREFLFKLPETVGLLFKLEVDIRDID